MPRRAVEKPFSDEQRELMSSAVRVAYFVAYRAARASGGLLDGDSAITAAHDGLIAAARCHRPEKGKFASFVGLKTKFEVKDAIQRATRHEAKNICSLDEPSPAGGTRMDTVAAPGTDMDMQIAVREVLLKIKPIHRKVLKLRMDGYTLEEVGKQMGCTKEFARQTEQKAEREMRQYFSPEDLN